MTDTRRPPACHYDRALRARVTNEHRDDCPGDPCPAAGHGCAPCTATHCVICGREHLTNATPQTCPGCQRLVDDDLADIQASYTGLAIEALDAGGDGRLVAAAPIPGGDAAVLIGPTVRLDVVRIGRHTLTDHRRGDPIPPLAVLSQWEDMYRAWLGHARAPRASIAGAIRYLRDQVPYVAQQTDGPDFLAFTRQVRKLRSMLEHALHDEREPERGVECFECGDQLVRRFRRARSCRHSTPARKELTFWGRLGYPEALSTADVRAARQPCGRCDQGGIEDPRAGLSWECPGCRKEYTAGEYTNAVRRSVMNEDKTLGWCLLSVAAEAAQDVTGRPVSAKVIRTWISRGDDVGTACMWQPGQRFAVQLVFWPDVLERAQERRSPGPRGRAC